MDASGESLQPQLKEAQKVLSKALDDACSEDLEEVDTGELIRIEEALVMASKAAKQAVSLRLVRRNQRARLGKQGAAADARNTPDDIPPQRVFEDFQGKRWHAFAVHPAYANSEPGALPEAFRQGWLAFRSETEMRRVAPLPPNWFELEIDQLRELCHKAEVATKRSERKPNS